MKHFTDPVDAVRDVLGMPRETPLEYPELVHPEPRADEPVVYDHKAEAESLMDDAEPIIDPRNRTNGAVQAAQVHATLALVAEQHLSNLIAAYAVHPSPAIRERIGKELGI